MSNSNQLTAKSLFARNDVQKRFEKMLDDNAAGFISSVLMIVNDNKTLKSADPMTVLNAAATAAALKLPINQNLGYAWIVPYKGQAQFQLGAKGYVQLAQRTGLYQQINVVSVYENQFTHFNALTEELDADFGINGEGKIIGYAAYFVLSNGFRKVTYWTVEKVKEHAKRYSKSFGGKFSSPWDDNFDAMAAKTVLKNMLAKWGPLSIEMQTAILSDQSVQKDEGKYQYIDNQTMTIEDVDSEKEKQRVIEHIENSKTLKELEQVSDLIEEYNLIDEYEAKDLLLKHPQK